MNDFNGSRSPVGRSQATDASRSEDRPQAIEGFAWYVHATTVAGEMVGPGLVGLWLDGYFGTGSVLAVTGFALGLVLGVWHLVRLSKLSSGPLATSRGDSAHVSAGSRSSGGAASGGGESARDLPGGQEGEERGSGR